MKCFRYAAVVFGLFLFAGMAMAQSAKPAYSLDALGRIEIGPDGAVRNYTLESELTPAVEELIDRSVRGWRFEPIEVDGRPVIATTRMLLQLEALPRSDGYALRVDDVSFGAPSRESSNQPPRYPRAALRAYMGAKVTLVLKLDGDGSVTRVHVEQSSLSDKFFSDKKAQHWRDLFADATRKAAVHWTFDIHAWADGAPLGTSVRVPVEYTMVRDGRHAPVAGAWRKLIPGPHHPAPWVDDATVAQMELDALSNGDVQVLQTRFKLKQDVVGSML